MYSSFGSYNLTEALYIKTFPGAAKTRSNLHLTLHAHVHKILIDEETKTARGVLVKVGDRLLKVKARKEVIVSGGAVNSPQLLMLSGIGPKEHLETLGIQTIADLKVGENLQDHVIFSAMMVGLT